MKKIARFLANVKKEMKKVRWPDKKEMTMYSVATIITVVVFALFFGGLDIVLGMLKMVIK